VANEVTAIDQGSDEIIDALARRIMAYPWSELDRVWEATNKICDRYELEKARYSAAVYPSVSARNDSCQGMPPSGIAMAQHDRSAFRRRIGFDDRSIRD